ncbi:MAG: AhpC/TSA family protein [Bacteroidaceae bacterium]|nr:AhpC/TSA family protein [Bacteroidaceae bacterium]
MRRIDIALLAISILSAACQPAVDRFAVNGGITGAEGKTLYLDHVAIDRIETLDSVKLGADGAFSFGEPAPEECFDFYRLRIGNQYVNLVIDSTETVTVKADLPTMQTGYTVEGSENCVKLKEIMLRQMQFMRDLRRTYDEFSGIETGVLQGRVQELVDVFKSDLMNGYIYPDPSTPYAYYVLFISANGQMLFNPQVDRQDARCFAAVATQMDMYYPDAVRTAHLHNVAMKGMSRTQPRTKPASEETMELFNSIVVNETGLIDIELPDVKGKIRSLSSLKGSVVLLDFTAYKTEWSSNYNLAMRELYNKYSSKGFEIYQVSVDSDESFWVNAAVNLPWVCVHDENSLGSQYLRSYNVSTIPTAFLIDREGNIVERPDDQKSLDGKIAQLVAE